jgi:hypothetical protein
MSHAAIDDQMVFAPGVVDQAPPEFDRSAPIAGPPNWRPARSRASTPRTKIAAATGSFGLPRRQSIAAPALNFGGRPNNGLPSTTPTAAPVARQPALQLNLVLF